MTFDYPDSYGPLCRRLGLDRGIPYTPKWSAEADFLALAVAVLYEEAPEVIVECSSGLSTLVLARACRLAGRGRVYSLENGGEFVEATREALAVYDLLDVAEVIHAPLCETRIGEDCWQWYDLSRLPVGAAQMLVIDGPPGFLQPLSRYPALPMLAERLAPGCRILLDDADRPDERALVARWQRDYPGLSVTWPETARGCASLRWPG